MTLPTDYTIKDALDELFANARNIIYRLGKEFTFESFRKAITQSNQTAYIKLLIAASKHEQIFGHAHQHLGARLSRLAAEMNYERIEEPGTTDQDLFGQPAKKVIYRRKSFTSG